MIKRDQNNGKQNITQCISIDRIAFGSASSAQTTKDLSSEESSLLISDGSRFLAKTSYSKWSFRIALLDQQESVEVPSTGGYGNYVKKSLGTIRLDQAGKYTLRIKPEKGHWQPINLRYVELKRREQQ
jgi:hypothetical protein